MWTGPWRSIWDTWEILLMEVEDDFNSHESDKHPDKVLT